MKQYTLLIIAVAWLLSGIYCFLASTEIEVIKTIVFIGDMLIVTVLTSTFIIQQQITNLKEHLDGDIR